MYRDSGCADDLVLAQWVDGELEPVRADLLYVHLETCASCRERVDVMTRAKRICDEHLWAEDETGREAADEAIARVRAQLARQLAAARPARTWWRHLAIAAAAVLAVVFVLRMDLWEPPVEASGARIIAAAALSERSWAWAPYHVRRRVLSVDYRGSAYIPDGRYRWVSLQWNRADGVATISKRFDEANRLVAAHWRDADGREFDYLADRPVPYEVIPSSAELRAALPRLEPARREALEAFLTRRETLLDQSEQRRSFETWFTRSTTADTRGATARRLESSRWGEVYYIRTDQRFEPSPHGPSRILAENYISADDLKRRRLLVTRYGPAGRVETQDTYWLAYEDATPADFEAESMGTMMVGWPVRYWTAVEVADRELEARARRLVPQREEGTPR